MARTYSIDFRERVLDARRANASAPEIEAIMKVSSRTIYRWEAQMRTQESIAPRPRSGRPRRIPVDQGDALIAQVAAHPDATLAEHCVEWEQQAGVRVGVSTMGRALTALGLHRKKRV